MAPAGGLGHRHVVVGRQGLGDDDPRPGGDRRRGRVDDEEDLHSERRPYQGARSDAVTGRSLVPAAGRWAGRLGDRSGFGPRPGPAQTRGMNVVVCVKQIPDPADPGALDPSTKTLKRDGKLILDESDSYGVEMALQLVDTAGGGEVTLVSMAPNGEVGGLRTALAMGAAKAILVSDDGPRRLRRPRHRQGAGQGHRAGGGRRPGPHRHRVVRRLHRHRARADRRACSTCRR